MFPKRVSLRLPSPNLSKALLRCHVYFPSLLLSKQDGMWGAGPGCQNQNQNTLVGRGSKRILPKYISLYVPLPLLPAAHQNEMRLSAGGLESLPGAGEAVVPVASNSRISGLPFSGVPGHAHPHTHLPGSVWGGMFSSSSPGLSAPQCAAK